MVLVLGFMVLLVPIMRLKDYANQEGIGLNGLWLQIKSFNLSSLTSLSLEQVLAYLKGMVTVPDSHLGFQKFQVEDDQETSELYTFIERILGIVQEIY